MINYGRGGAPGLALKFICVFVPIWIFRGDVKKEDRPQKLLQVLTKNMFFCHILLKNLPKNGTKSTMEVNGWKVVIVWVMNV